GLETRRRRGRLPHPPSMRSRTLGTDMCYRSIAALVAVCLIGGFAQGETFSGESALRFTGEAVSFGPRPAGSAPHRKLQEYIKRKTSEFGCEVREDAFTAQTPAGPKQMTNLIAVKSGNSGQAVVISGHYETKLMPEIRFVGANDAGSSTGLLLELARVLCGKSQRHDLYLVWFDGEEAIAAWSESDSLYGSRHLAEKWAADGSLKRIKALINIDMIGDRDLKMVQEMNSAEWLRSLVWNTAAGMGHSRHFPNIEGWIEDDHMPFVRKGVPALDLIDLDYGPANSFWHTASDTLDKLSADSFRVTGEVLLSVLKRLQDKGEGGEGKK
ncbi:MAG: M28 family peptidase, partial [Bryobacteraceae bacterium]